ncbi:MAG: hypothetical protein ACREDJ_08450, partial [Methylocella sp.]
PWRRPQIAVVAPQGTEIRESEPAPNALSAIGPSGTRKLAILSREVKTLRRRRLVEADPR